MTKGSFSHILLLNQAWYLSQTSSLCDSVYIRNGFPSAVGLATLVTPCLLTRSTETGNLATSQFPFLTNRPHHLAITHGKRFVRDQLDSENYSISVSLTDKFVKLLLVHFQSVFHSTFLRGCVKLLTVSFRMCGCIW